MAKSTKRKQERTINPQSLPAKDTGAHKAARANTRRNGQKQRPSGPANDENVNPTKDVNGESFLRQPNTRSRAQASGQKDVASEFQILGQAPARIMAKQQKRPPVQVQAATENDLVPNVATDDDLEMAAAEEKLASPKATKGKKNTQFVVRDSDIELEGSDEVAGTRHLDESEDEVKAPRKVRTTYKSRFKKVFEAEGPVGDSESDFESEADNDEVVTKTRKHAVPSFRGSAGLSNEDDMSAMANELERLKQQLLEEKGKLNILPRNQIELT